MLSLLWISASEQDWSGGTGQTPSSLLHNLGIAGASIVGLLFVFAVLRALSRNSRYRAIDTLSDADIEQIHHALRDAEAKTVGEILPVVVERSDPHPGAPWVAALVTLLSGSVLLAAYMPWDSPGWLMACQLGLGILGFAAAWLLPDLRHLFITEDRASKVASEQAFQEFYANGLHETEAATGVLLFVSLLEHRVIVMGDSGINSLVETEDWENTDRAILDGIRSGSLCKGLVDGIGVAGELLEKHFPWADGDRNEIPDRVIVRRE